MIQERHNNYDKNHCWQYDIRLNNLEKDLEKANMTLEESKLLRVSDFIFENVDMKDTKTKQELTQFIKENEWLGNLTQYNTAFFQCRLKSNNILAGVLVFSMPNAFSKLLGEDTKDLERLISRGACISWSPKNLASSFVMWCIKWMVQNTQYRLFTAYSDPTAKELGTIYQACNFYYLGQKSGTTTRYINPYTGKVVSDRFFRQKTAYRKYAVELGFKWEKDWSHKTGINWENIPDDIEKLLREHSKQKQKSSQKIDMPSKHKYAYVLGKDNRETKMLRKIFEERNKLYSYPKER